MVVAKQHIASMVIANRFMSVCCKGRLDMHYQHYFNVVTGQNL